jgi:hypothetical protein
LFDFLTDEPIYPSPNGIFIIYYASNEEPYPRKFTGTASQLSKLYFYKFSNLNNCKTWCENHNYKHK